MTRGVLGGGADVDDGGDGAHVYILAAATRETEGEAEYGDDGGEHGDESRREC